MGDCAGSNPAWPVINGNRQGDNHLCFLICKNNLVNIRYIIKSSLNGLNDKIKRKNYTC